MRIALMTHLFAPSIGGIETMSRILAHALVDHGHEVRVITPTPSLHAASDDDGLRVHRAPTRQQLREVVTWSDICWHNNISLAMAWPILLSRKPWVVTTQTWIARQHDGTLGWRERVKRLLLRRATSVAISPAVAASLPIPSCVIPNAYEADIFRQPATDAARNQQGLIFVGRLVSDKGVDLVIHALAALRRMGQRPQLTIVGSGPERAKLVTLSRELDLESQINFIGSLAGSALAACLARHRIQVVPSRWAEPFGIVALEGAACGCTVIGSAGGGLPDAIGPCGYTFAPGDASDLANRISGVLDGTLPPLDPVAVGAHLRRHTSNQVAAEYAALFERLLSPQTVKRGSR